MEKTIDPRFIIKGCENSDKEAIVRPTITYAQDAWRRLRKNPIAMGFIFPNAAHHQKLEKYMSSVDDVEKATGLDFFSRLPDSIENRIEAIVPALPSGG